MKDLIDRWVAYAVNESMRLSEAIKDLQDKTSIQAVLRWLPSAQPEIIRCRDCKYSEHWYRDRRRCFLWSEDGVSVFDNGFCNYADRRQDE